MLLLMLNPVEYTDVFEPDLALALDLVFPSVQEHYCEFKLATLCLGLRGHLITNLPQAMLLLIIIIINRPEMCMEIRKSYCVEKTEN
jgi:hypothetical protein